MARSGRALFQRLQLHHAAHGAGGDDGACDLVRRRPAGHPLAGREEDRPGGTQRRAADASGEVRHADHGRRADPDRHRRHDAALGRPDQQVRVDGADRHPGFGIVGWYDDWKKVVYRNPKGLAAGWKYFWQSVLGVGAALFLAFSANSPAQTELIVPFFKSVAYPLGVVGFITLTYFVIVGTSNAVNLTDGLDGLAIMPTVMIAAAFAIFAYVAGNAVYAKYLSGALRARGG
jgi:hypothetical protein